MKNLCHSASFDSCDNGAPSKSGIKHLDLPVQLADADLGRWINYSPDYPLAEQSHVRVPGGAVFQMVPGGNRPDVVIFADQQPASRAFVWPSLPQRAETGIIAVGEIKGRLDLSNAWESWMPQVVTHIRLWSDAYPSAGRLFFGTLLTSEMVGSLKRGERETLRSIHAELTNGINRLTAAYNLTKLGERDEPSVAHFTNLITAIAMP